MATGPLDQISGSVMSDSLPPHESHPVSLPGEFYGQRGAWLTAVHGVVEELDTVE